MGHYAGEMGYIKSDEFNYKAVNEAGFESVSSRSYYLKRCPKCFCLVEGKYALQHLAAAHPERENG